MFTGITNEFEFQLRLNVPVTGGFAAVTSSIVMCY